MCAPRLGTVLAMHFREVVVTPFIASAVARGGIGDPTRLLAHSAVEVEAARTMGMHGRHFSTGACLLVPSLQTHCGIEGGERLMKDDSMFVARGHDSTEKTSLRCWRLLGTLNR